MQLYGVPVQSPGVPLLRRSLPRPPDPLFFSPQRFCFKPQISRLPFLLKPQTLRVSRCVGGHGAVEVDDTGDGATGSPEIGTGEELAGQGLLQQMREIVKFSGPATGLWICGPLMSLIDTAVIGQGSSLELAALAFVGPTNVALVPAANSYVQIRGLAWPFILIGWVAQSASLGMKDSWGPLKALSVASAVNGIGDIALCSFMGYGIAGAAWDTMVSQVIAAYMMIAALNNKGYNAFALSVPLAGEFISILGLAAPVFITMMSKVAFYSLLIYFATSMGTISVAAHQVMLQMFSMCTVWGEPLSQTAQSFMPELIYGEKRNLEKARMLLKSLLTIGALLRVTLGCFGTFFPWCFPGIFTSDQNVIREMHTILVPYFMALSVTPPTHSLEGTLLAGRDLKFISASMSRCLVWGALLLLFVNSKSFGLMGCWFTLSGFQWARFFIAFRRLTSPRSFLNSD